MEIRASLALLDVFTTPMVVDAFFSREESQETQAHQDDISLVSYVNKDYSALIHTLANNWNLIFKAIQAVDVECKKHITGRLGLWSRSWSMTM